VVVQRDGWEDHYRLFEALASGPMVLADKMLGLPRGLENGTNLVLFDILLDMERLILHYLAWPEERIAISKRGLEMAMGQHRTWHRMEELVFGCPLTRTGPPYLVA
jgi:spore maturation protein CgeB